MFYSLDEKVRQVIARREDLTFQSVNGDYLKLQYFAQTVGWHSEDRDEFFIVLEGTIDFSVEENEYHMKRGRPSRHRIGQTAQSEFLRLRPAVRRTHDKGR